MTSNDRGENKAKVRERKIWLVFFNTYFIGIIFFSLISSLIFNSLAKNFLISDYDVAFSYQGSDVRLKVIIPIGPSLSPLFEDNYCFFGVSGCGLLSFLTFMITIFGLFFILMPFIVSIYGIIYDVTRNKKGIGGVFIVRITIFYYISLITWGILSLIVDEGSDFDSDRIYYNYNQIDYVQKELRDYFSTVSGSYLVIFVLFSVFYFVFFMIYMFPGLYSKYGAYKDYRRLRGSEVALDLARKYSATRFKELRSRISSLTPQNLEEQVKEVLREDIGRFRGLCELNGIRVSDEERLVQFCYDVSTEFVEELRDALRRYLTEQLLREEAGGEEAVVVEDKILSTIDQLLAKFEQMEEKHTGKI